MTKIIVDKQIALKAVCELMQLEYEQAFEVGVGLKIIPIEADISFDFDKGEQ